MLTESPHLLAENVNHWFTSANERRMVRMLDGNVRAFLSDRYQRIDNYEVADAALKAFQTIQEQTGTQLQFLSTEVTNTRLYINARFPRVEGEVKKDDPVQMGITISNSEIGSGRLLVQPLLYRLVCLNGMIMSSDMDDYGLKKQHVGRKVEAL